MSVLNFKTSAQVFDIPEKKIGIFEVMFSGGKTSSYYGIDGSTRLFDIIGTTLTSVTLTNKIDLKLTSNLTANMELPLNYIYLISDSLFPERSILNIKHFGIGLTYSFLNSSNFVLGFSSMFKIPNGFHQGLYNDTKYLSFWGDGYFQFNSNGIIKYKLEDQFIKFTLGYNWRDEEAKDEILYKVEAGTSKTKGTGLLLFCEGVVSTKNPANPSKAFYPGSSGESYNNEVTQGGDGKFYMIESENYTSLGAKVIVYLTNDLFLDGSYSIKLFGVNTLLLNQANFGIGYPF